MPQYERVIYVSKEGEWCDPLEEWEEAWYQSPRPFIDEVPIYPDQQVFKRQRLYWNQPLTDEAVSEFLKAKKIKVSAPE